MSMFEDCPTEVREVIGAPAAGGAMTVSFVPAVGERWEILYASVRHDDVAAPAGYWQVGDGVLALPISVAAALLPNTYLPLYNANISGRLFLTYLDAFTQNLEYDVDVGATGGSILTLDIIGRVLRGVL